jgi:hypothetical protein
LGIQLNSSYKTQTTKIGVAAMIFRISRAIPTVDFLQQQSPKGWNALVICGLPGLFIVWKYDVLLSGGTPSITMNP